MFWNKLFIMRIAGDKILGGTAWQKIHCENFVQLCLETNFNLIMNDFCKFFRVLRALWSPASCLLLLLCLPRVSFMILDAKSQVK